MDRSKKIEQFPDVDKKLAASAKKSLFEQQRAEAEAKRIREEKETAAVYASFVASFDDEEEAPQQGSYGQGGYGGGQGGFAQPKRHYGPPTGPAAGRGFAPQRAGFTGPLRSGPGSLGPAPHTVPRSGPGSLGPAPHTLLRSGPGSLGPAPHQGRGGYTSGPGYGTPLGFEQPPQRRQDDRSFASDDHDHSLPPQHASRGPKVPAAFSTSDDEDEAADSGWRAAEPPVPKPTIQMSNLPPGTSPAAIKALLPSNLIVEAVRILPPPPPSGPNNTERKSMSAIVTLSKETAASDIDSTVSQLRDKYLGWGFYLSLSRGLSSAALESSSLTHLSGSSSANFQPFGAKVADLSQPAPSSRMNQHAPPTSYKGIAPPASYHTPAIQKPSGPVLIVEVKPPGDIKEIRLIHKTLENLLTHGPEFEALLMSRPDVQREEKWAWLFNARSTGGVYYRWRLFSLLSGTEAKGRYVPVFEDSAAWKAPEKPLPFEYTTHLDEFVEDEHYISSDGSDSESEHRPPIGLGLGEEGPSFLGQMQKAHLTHLLARLPSNVQKLRRGDVARVTAFALRNAKRGAPEVVEMVVENVSRPYSASGANREYKSSRPMSRDGSRGEGEEKVEDTSAASLVGLRLIPDIISAALNSGVSNARVYRQLFEDAIRKRKVFEYLAKLDRKYGWGRMSSEKWKSVVKGELGRWKDSCMFMPGAPEGWLETFCNPPISKEEEERERVREEERVKKEKESRWKAVREREMADREEAERVDAEMEDVDGAPMTEHDDVDGVPMEEENVDGVPMVDSDVDVDGEALAMDEDEPVEAPAPPSAPDTEKGGEETSGKGLGSAGVKMGFKIEVNEEKVRPVRKRPRAEDMFADSDEDEKHPSAS